MWQFITLQSKIYRGTCVVAMTATPSLRKLSARYGKTVLKMKEGRGKEGKMEGWMEGGRGEGKRKKKT